MCAPIHRSWARCTVISSICFVLLIFLGSTTAAWGQQSVLVACQFSSTSVLDLSTLSLTKTINAGWLNWSVVVDPNNPRLAYVGAAAYVSVFDLTIGREVNRIRGVYGGGFMALTTDGKYLLLGDNSSYSLDVIDTARQALVRKVDLRPAMGTGATNGFLGSIVVVGHKAYVLPQQTDFNRPAAAVVDLRTFTVKPIPVPPGFLNGSLNGNPNGAATPDGKTVAMIEDYNSDGTPHLLLINTSTDRVVDDFLLSADPAGLLITPVNTYGSIWGYLLGTGGDGKFAAYVLDLNPQNGTFGQILPATEVPLNSFLGQGQLTAAALSGNGGKLVVGGLRPGTSNPNPNVVEVDTGLMFTNPGGAIVGHATVAGGVRPYGISVATVTTTPPLTAPTVTSVTGPINNSVANTITVTGTNFNPGAMVRIGTMPPIPATGITSTSLQVTVPQNAPAQAGLDVIVTNPGTGGPRSQQYQSGVLPAGLTITANPAFVPLHQFASLSASDRTVALYEPAQGTMINVPNAVVPAGITFNADGAEIYGAAAGKRGFVGSPRAVSWSTADDTVTAQVPFTGGFGAGNLGSAAIAASVNPANGNAVVFVPITTRVSNLNDVALEMVDTNSSSGNFNTVLQTISLGLGLANNQGLQIYSAAATPNGKYVYVNFIYNDGMGVNYFYKVAIFDVVHGVATTFNTGALGVAQLQYFMSVTPDGQSLLMTGYSANPAAGPIAVLDISQNPLLPVTVATIAGTPPSSLGTAGAFYFSSWQVIGNRLLALDAYSQGVMVAFNFDRTHSNFSQLGTYSFGSPQAVSSYIGVSPDGALIYVPTADALAVLDANKLASGQNSLITNIGAFRAPRQAAVSPVPFNPASLQVSTTSLPSGTQGVAYSASLAATGGVPPYVWSIASGSLPSGLALSSSGAITGIPSGATGPSNFTVKVTDTKSHTATSVTLTITIQPGTPLSIITTSLPSSPVNVPYYAVLAATGGVPPYTWSITSGSLPTGMNPLSSSGVISGTPTLSGTYPFTVQVTDSAASPNHKSQPLSILVNSYGNTSLLSGTYAFQLDAFTQSAGQAAYLGSFVADGNGNITSGTVDINAVNAGPFSYSLSGNYSIAGTGFGTINLTINGQPLVLAFVLSSTGNGRIIEYDDTTGNGNRGSGLLLKQDTTAFSLSKISGTYVYGFVGADKQANRFANVGEFHADGAGNISSGLGDENDSGDTGSYTFSGTQSAVNSTTGRTTGVFTGTFGTSHLTTYVVNSSQLLMMETDSVQSTGTPLQSGTVLLQTGSGSFNNGSMNGVSVITDQDLDVKGGGAEAFLGFLTTDGAGNWSVFLDQNKGGTLTQQSDAGRYSVASNGRMTLGSQSPIFYLVSQNQAFFIGTDQSVEFGFLDPQTGGPFSNASLTGTFAGGTLPLVDNNGSNEVTNGSTDGAGNVYVNSENSGGSGLGQDLGQQDTYNFAPNGRGTLPDGSILYLISPTKFALLEKGQNPKISVYEH